MRNLMTVRPHSDALRLSKWLQSLATPHVALGFFAGYMTCMLMMMFLNIPPSTQVGCSIPDGRSSRAESFQAFTTGYIAEHSSGRGWSSAGKAGEKDKSSLHSQKSGAGSSSLDYDDVGIYKFRGAGSKSRPPPPPPVLSFDAFSGVDYDKDQKEDTDSEEQDSGDEKEEKSGADSSDYVKDEAAADDESFSSLTVKDGPRPVTPQDWRQRALAQQTGYCTGKNASTLPRTKPVKFDTFTLNVYDKADIVSDALLKQGTWEAGDLVRVFRAMAATINRKLVVDPLFVDVGANVGWFSMSVAGAGYRVAAYEAMQHNVVLLRSTLCLNPKLQKKVELYDFGLSTINKTCYMVSASDNEGDGHVLCDMSKEEALVEASHMNPPGYKLRGTVQLERLDQVLDRDVQVMKIDVEGHELMVLRGAEALLRQRHVWFMVVEYNKELLGSAPQHDDLPGDNAGAQLLLYLDKMGYRISTHSFLGPWLKPSQIASGKIDLEGQNIFCRHRDYHR